MKHFLPILLLSLLSATSFAQQAIWQNTSVKSPEINPDGTVTFRLFSPNSREVSVMGEFVPEKTIKLPNGQEIKSQQGEFTKNDKGIWEYTTPNRVKPELYNYTFMVDGVKTLDLANVYVNRDVSTLTSMLLVEGDPIVDLYKVQDVKHGTVTKIWYHSDTQGFDRRLTVYTPAGYETSGKRYPVFYLLHGMGGDEEAWYTQGRTTQILDNLIAQGKAEPMIVVMPNGNISQKAAPGEGPEGMVPPTMSLPQTMEGTYETSFPEIVKFIDTTYRTKADKKNRAIAGLSMGGFHSCHISKQYPDMFDYVGLFSAAINHGNGDSEIYKDFDSKLDRQFSAKYRPALYYIAIGKEDFLYKDNENLRAKLDSKKYPYIYNETDGGHIWRNWRKYLADFAPRLFK